MLASRRSIRTAWFAFALISCSFISGCGPKPSAEAEKMHPDGIGLDIETIPKPVAKPAK